MERAARVRAEIVRQKETALAIGEAGPPCVRCTYFNISNGNCGNPAYFEQTFDPVYGRYSTLVKVDAEKARAADGLCGPEGLLFERETGLQKFIRLFATAFFMLVVTVIVTSLLRSLFAYI